MREIILDTSLLPEPLWGMINSPQMRVRETEQGLMIMPIATAGQIGSINKVRGLYKDGKLSVETFLAERRAEERE